MFYNIKKRPIFAHVFHGIRFFKVIKDWVVVRQPFFMPIFLLSFFSH